MTAPRPAVAPRRTRPVPPPPALRLVPAPQTPRRMRMVLVLSTVLVFGVMLLAVAVHTTMVSGQQELDQVNERIAETSRQNQSLRLQVAELESPARIVEAATEDGMVVPEDVTWLTPQADAGSAPRRDRGAVDPSDTETGDQRAADGSAADRSSGGSDR